MKIQNLYKLFTNEDPFNIHKILGITSLIHFIYRFYCLIIYETSFLDVDETTPYLICIHMLLSGTSLIFHIPSNRIKNKPMIYPEFRLHSILFAYRSLICTLLFYYKAPIMFNIIVLFYTLFIADIITNYYKSTSKTMRNMPYDTFIKEDVEKKKINKIYGGMQGSATLMTLGNIHTAFTPAFAIQLAALLMTLVRKSIITARQWHIIYMISLFINIHSFTTLSIHYILSYTLLGKVFEYTRFECRLNKYASWSIICGLFYGLNNSIIVNWFDENKFISSYETQIKYGVMILFYINNFYKTRRLYF